MSRHPKRKQLSLEDLVLSSLEEKNFDLFRFIHTLERFQLSFEQVCHAIERTFPRAVKTQDAVGISYTLPKFYSMEMTLTITEYDESVGEYSNAVRPRVDISLSSNTLKYYPRPPEEEI